MIVLSVEEWDRSGFPFVICIGTIIRITMDSNLNEATRKKWFEDLRKDVWRIIASVELTPEEGDALIEEIRIRVRSHEQKKLS